MVDQRSHSAPTSGDVYQNANISCFIYVLAKVHTAQEAMWYSSTSKNPGLGVAIIFGKLVGVVNQKNMATKGIIELRSFSGGNYWMRTRSYGNVWTAKAPLGGFPVYNLQAVG